MKNNRRYLFRMIIPAMADNVFNRIMKKTIALGPVMVATAAGELPDWDAEIIHEAGSQKQIPRNAEGKINHFALQKERPADAIGLYCGISSTMPRAWQIAKFYQKQRVLTVAGGLHSHYEPLESLKNGIDAVIHGDGEETIKKILIYFQNFPKERNFSKIQNVSCFENEGVGFLKSDFTQNSQKYSAFLDNLPDSDFGLIRDCKIKTYPIGRIRGCGMRCEFCSVKEIARWASPEKLFETIGRLVKVRKAKKFFLVDDRMEEDKKGSMRFFELISKRYGRKLDFTIQIRLEAAQDEELLALLQKAGVRRVCIGYESPIDEELKKMKKGYRSREMLEWTKIYHRYDFLVHAMFIFGYPGIKSPLSAKERLERFKKFIFQSKVDSIQVLKPIPLVGSLLRERLKSANRLLPLVIVPWEKYDGNHICFLPEDMSLKELQEYPTQIMKWFYDSWSFWRIGLRTVAMPFVFLWRGWHFWHRGWWNDIVRFGGSRIFKKWKRQNNEILYVKNIEDFLNKNLSFKNP